MHKLILYICFLITISAKSQSRFPDHDYNRNLTSLGNLWAYVEKIDHALDSSNAIIDSLRHQLYLQKKLLQFNTDMCNYYIRKEDSFRIHGIGVYQMYKQKDTLSLGPFYIY